MKKVSIIFHSTCLGGCVIGLGDLLRVTTSMTKLYLEWNCLGQDQEAFSQFCSGLAGNTSLEVLDLRSTITIKLYILNIKEDIKSFCHETSHD